MVTEVYIKFIDVYGCAFVTETALTLSDNFWIWVALRTWELGLE